MGRRSVIGVGAARAGNLNPNVLKVICDARTKALKTDSLSDRSRERTESPRIVENSELSRLLPEDTPQVWFSDHPGRAPTSKTANVRGRQRVEKGV